jgi:hypothetical protein
MRLRQAQELRAAISAELAEMVAEIEALREREDAPADVEDFLANAHDTMTRLEGQSRPHGNTAETAT